MTIVDDYVAACAFLQSIGMQQKAHEETKRESWELQGAEIELDTWTWVPSLIEIDARNEELIQSIAKLLQLDYQKALYGCVETACMDVYDVTEADY